MPLQSAGDIEFVEAAVASIVVQHFSVGWIFDTKLNERSVCEHVARLERTIDPSDVYFIISSIIQLSGSTAARSRLHPADHRVSFYPVRCARTSEKNPRAFRAHVHVHALLTHRHRRPRRFRCAMREKNPFTGAQTHAHGPASFHTYIVVRHSAHASGLYTLLKAVSRAPTW